MPKRGRINKPTRKLPTMLIEDARIIFRNFSGRATKFTPAGNRTFSVLLAEEDAKRMEEAGWNIKWPEQNKNDPDSRDLLPYTEIKVSYKYPDRSPKIYQITSGNQVELGEEEVSGLDSAEIEHIDMVINPSYWEMGDKNGLKGYLRKMFVTIREDELDKKYRLLAQEAMFDADEEE